MDINVTIKAEGLESALNNLATALLESKNMSESDTKDGNKRRGRGKGRGRDKAADPEEVTIADEVTSSDEVTTDCSADDMESSIADDENMFDSEEPAPTREEVQKRLKELANAGKTAKIKELLLSYNIKKFSEVPDGKLAEILKKAEAL